MPASLILFLTGGVKPFLGINVFTMLRLPHYNFSLRIINDENFQGSLRDDFFYLGIDRSEEPISDRKWSDCQGGLTFSVIL